MMDEMNDVHDFMARFEKDFEIKWGLAVDPSLGQQVKVTILATGFGVEHVDGMSNHLRKTTQEEVERLAHDEEKAEERRIRRDMYYGNEGSGTKAKRRPHLYLFRSEDLDNDDVINAIENSPTYKRTRQNIEEIRKMANGGELKTTEETSNEAVQGTISF